MKTILATWLFAFVALFAVSNAAAAEKNLGTPAPEENLLNDKIYFFVHSLCQNCRHAYVYLNRAYPELDIPLTDMGARHNLDLYKQCVKKFNISNKELTLPLICMGDTYIMGWDETFPEKFKQALSGFQTPSK